MYRYHSVLRRVLRHPRLAALVALLVLGATVSSVQAAEDPPLTTAEEWVVKQVAQGLDADLDKSQQSDRFVRAFVLRGVLSRPTPDTQTQRPGIRIAHVVVPDALLLPHTQFAQTVSIEDSQFSATLDLSKSTVKGGLSLERSEFFSMLELDQFISDNDLDLKGAILHKSANVTDATIHGNIIADGLQLTDASGAFDISGTKIDHDVSLTSLNFSGSLKSLQITVGGGLDLSYSRFMNTDSLVDLSNVTVSKDITSKGVNLAGTMFLDGANIGKSFVADAAELYGVLSLRLNTATVGGSVKLNKVRVGGGIDFVRLTTGVDLEVTDSEFNGSEQRLDLSSMQIGRTIILSGSVFNGPLDLYHSTVTDNLYMQYVQIRGPNGSIGLRGVKVSGGSVFIDKSSFYGNSDLGEMTIGQSIFAGDSHYIECGKYDCLSLNTTKTTSSVFLSNATFAGSVDFTKLDAGVDVDLQNSRFNGALGGAWIGSARVGRNLNLNGAHIDDKLVLDSTNVQGILWLKGTVLGVPPATQTGGLGQALVAAFKSLVALGNRMILGGPLSADAQQTQTANQSASMDGLTVGELAVLVDTKFYGSVSLRRANLKGINALNVTWPDGRTQVRLDGLSFDLISNEVLSDATTGRLTREGNSSSAVEAESGFRTSVLDNAVLDAAAYTRLETMIRSHAHPDEANAVFVQAKQRERDEVFGWLSPANLWSYFLDATVCYGKCPDRTLGMDVVVIAVGAWVFRNRNWMTLQTKFEQGESEPAYSGFWYSLDSFAPVVDLQARTLWHPAPNHPRRLLFWRLEMLAGWILVPIGVAAWTGILK